MQIFNLEDQRLTPTAIEAHLCHRRQGAGFTCLWAEGREGVCLLLDTEEVQEHRGPLFWGHVHFLETAVHLDGDVLRTIGIRDATVVPEHI